MSTVRPARRRSFADLFSGYVVPVMVASVGVVTLVFSVTHHVPSPDELREVRGPLTSYEFARRSRKGSAVAVLSVANEPTRFWSNAVSPQSAPSVLGPARQEGTDEAPEVRLFVERAPAHRPDDGVFKAYGLWVNGRPIRTLDGSIRRDRLTVGLVLPLLGMVMLVLAVLLHRKYLKKLPE